MHNACGIESTLCDGHVFDTSDVTGKRDYQKLKRDKNGYYAPCDGESLWLLDYEEKKVVRRNVSRELMAE